MFEASLFEVLDGDGKSWAFGDLIKDQKTVVVFIRHWYCPLCQGAFDSLRLPDPHRPRAPSLMLLLSQSQTTSTRSSRTSTQRPSSAPAPNVRPRRATIQSAYFQLTADNVFSLGRSHHYRKRRAGRHPQLSGQGIQVPVPNLHRPDPRVRRGDSRNLS